MCCRHTRIFAWEYFGYANGILTPCCLQQELLTAKFLFLSVATYGFSVMLMHILESTETRLVLKSVEGFKELTLR